MRNSDMAPIIVMLVILIGVLLGALAVGSEQQKIRNEDKVWCESNGGRWIEFSKSNCVFLPDNK